MKGSRFLGEGWTSRSFVVDDSLVYRCPKEATDWEWLHREIAFLRFAADRLPLPVPRYGDVQPRSARAPHGYATYRLIPGRSAGPSLSAPAHRAETAEALARFLEALHALRPPPEVEDLLPREDPRENAEFVRHLVMQQGLPQLGPDQLAVVHATIRTYLDTAAHFAFRPVVIHADFNTDNILVDDAGRVSGVVDFGDVCFGDPDFDFSYLLLELGTDFALDVARRYGHAAPERLPDKLRYFAMVDQIGTILCDGGRSLPGHREEAWERLRALISAG